MSKRLPFFAAGLLLLTNTLVVASEESTSELTKATQNPVADLISLPFQNNTNFEAGPDGETQNILNIQPVWPVDLNDDWLLITRTIAPVISQPSGLTPADDGRIFGLGDITFSAFLSPKKEGVIWGAGPIFLLPTATDDSLGSDKWGAGLSFVALDMPGSWVYGALISNVWSLAGSGDQDVNLFTLQPFVNYNFPSGWYLSSVPIITANWEANKDQRWTIPLGLGFGKLVKLGKAPVNLQAHAYKNVVTPDGFGADWQLRLQVQLLFPK